MGVLDLVGPLDPPLGTIATASGLRSRSPEDLRRVLTPLLWSQGITRVAHLTGFDVIGVPVHMAMKPQGRSLASGSGKGLTEEASWLSAVMEAWEQTVWEGLPFPDPQGVLASAASLVRLGVRPIDASRCARTFHSVWTVDSPTYWTAGINLRDGEPTWVPTELVVLPPAPDRPLSAFVSGSNGLASGAHVLEAMLSALLEVVERDGLALASNSGMRYDPTQTLAKISPGLLDRIVNAGLVIEVIDATSDIGVPTYVALLGEPNGGPPGAFKGAGAALDPDVALVRAVTEAIQSRCVIVAGARDDVFETARAAAVRFAKPRTKPEIALPERPTQATGSILGDLERVLTLLDDAGFHDVVAIRHTVASDPVQVVRVIVPGLEGYPFANAAPGARALSMQVS